MAKERIAILGGGIGALAAASALTEVPGWRDRYEITVYQTGWRLGGKGASARRLVEEGAWRIEEHGPHIWFGFYFNAFRTIAGAYDYCAQQKLTPESPFRSWEDAFQPKRNGTFMEYVGRTWRPWLISLPDRPGSPLQPGDVHPWIHIRDAIALLMRWRDDLQAMSPSKTVLPKRPRFWTRWLGTIYDAAAKLFGHRLAPLEDRDSLLHRAHRLALAPHLDPRSNSSGTVSWFGRVGLWIMQLILHEFRRRVRRDVDELLAEHDGIRHLWELLDLGVSTIYGLLADEVPIKGFDAIENIDYSHWLEKHGCSSYWSAPVHGIYDSGAHYEKGIAAPPDRPNERPPTANLAAGTAVHALLRMFAGYSGAFSYKMQAGMGETVFTPLYLSLAHKGVKFAFFHRTTQLRLSADGTQIAAVEMQVQARVSVGPESYKPLLDPIGGIRCWPATPLYDQLQEGEKLKSSGVDLENGPSDVGYARTLRRGEDFDKVVLGIPIAALPAITTELGANALWSRMLGGVKSVQTQFIELWAKLTSEQLCGSNQEPVVEAFAEPYSTWLDMTQVLARECWPPSAGTQSVHYFVGPLEETLGELHPEEEHTRVKEQALDFLRSRVLGLWPNAALPGNRTEFDWDLLAAPASLQGEARFDSQYWRANVQPAERYILSTVGSKFCRLRSDDSGFRNLYLAGDWTLNGLNAGSVEAAVMSGIQAAQGVSGLPLEILGGYHEMRQHSTETSAPQSEPRRQAAGK